VLVPKISNFTPFVRSVQAVLLPWTIDHVHVYNSTDVHVTITLTLRGHVSRISQTSFSHTCMYRIQTQIGPQTFWGRGRGLVRDQHIASSSTFP
jgi:hypothetical protein